MKVALAGNPNCGKTTVFNELTGSSQYVGNWPGVTVEKKEGRVRFQKDLLVVDLPGIYSLSPYTIEELIARDYLLKERPDVILNIVDACNLERNLYLTTQLLELNLPVVVLLNMMDVVENEGHVIDSKALEQELGCPVVEASAVKAYGLREAVQRITVEIKKDRSVNHIKQFARTVEDAIRKIMARVPDHLERWQAIKILERDRHYLDQERHLEKHLAAAEEVILELEQKMDNDSESIIIQERYHYIENLCGKYFCRKEQKSASVTDRIDKILTNKWLAIPIFFMIMWLVYYISIQTIGSQTIEWIDSLFHHRITGQLQTVLKGAGVSVLLQGLILNGILGGLGAIFTFVPQIMILFFFLSLLEDCGYMARIAFIMDKPLRKFGLSGKSFIPMLIGSGCSVPAILASRTVDHEIDRKLTIMLTPFIPCSAKLPVFALFVGAFFPKDAWVAATMYLLGISTVIAAGILLKRTKAFGGKVSSFIMELPPYRLPTIKGVLIHMWERGKTFIVKAGTVIFIASMAVWLMQSFNWNFEMVPSEESILASVGHVIAPLFAPLGFGSWQSAVAIVSGFLAKENVVSTLAILLGVSGEGGDPALMAQLQEFFSPLSAYAFMVFTLFAAPCFAAIGAIKREVVSWKWTFIIIGFQTGLAYLFSLLIYQIGSLIL